MTTRSPLVALGLFCSALCWSAGSLADPATAPPEDPVLDFQVAEWQASAYSLRVSGPIGWLRGPDGSLRLEIGAEESPAGFDVLLDRSGDGWTLILGPDGEGTLNAWGREWSRIDPGLAELAGQAVAFFEDRNAGPDLRRLVIPELDPGGAASSPERSLRGEMVRRGRGRGGRGEVVLLERLAAGDPAGVFRIRSTRRPGEVRVGPPAARALACPVPEVFLPLWPLRDLALPVAGKSPQIPGTSNGGRGT